MYHHNFKTPIAFHFVKDIHKQVGGGEKRFHVCERLSLFFSIHLLN